MGDEGGWDNTAGVGTPVYGSPEQLSGGDYDEKTDVFSLGVMLFEVTTRDTVHTTTQRASGGLTSVMFLLVYFVYVV
jgi:serine/threonine protein kinase